MRCFLTFWSTLLVLTAAHGAESRYDGPGSDGIRYIIQREDRGLTIKALGPGVDGPDQTFFVAIGRPGGSGSPLLPADGGKEGSVVWLPFAADLLVTVRSGPDGRNSAFLRRWNKTAWGAPEKLGDGFSLVAEPAQLVLGLPEKMLAQKGPVNISAYLKDMAADGGRGRLYGAIDPAVASGPGERALRHYLVMDAGGDGPMFRRAGRTDPERPRTRIYQLLPRLFGNTNETRKRGGTLEENGCGKFRDLSDSVLAGLKATGFTHLWLTGVLQQATATDYSAIGEPADDPDLLKGLAGSPYAVRDYYDLSPDYAVDPAKRKEEFTALLDRAHARGMKVLIDFVPNHVARSYHSSIKPNKSFGARDDRAKFFDSKNNFFYLTPEAAAEGGGPPLRLPTAGPAAQESPRPGMDGLFDGEKDFGRVTGNNVTSWAPPADSWYETAKLNYGYDFAHPEKPVRAYPHGDHGSIPLPDTWTKMDEIIAYWQELGVDGFRVDMAHMVPPEFWHWLIARARSRKLDTYFLAEAYNDKKSAVSSGNEQTAVVTGGEVMAELLNAGFDAVYDDATYDKLKEVCEGKAAANDLDTLRPRAFIFDNALRYAENHDEVRLAAPGEWGGHGMNMGRPVCALLFGLSRGPVMVYHGQEVGEPALGAEGFGGDDGRTTIFDYWSMPEFAKWFNGGTCDGAKLSGEQQELREFYRRLLTAADQPAFRDGDFYPLNPDNADNPGYGAFPGEVGGRWLYCYLRYDKQSGQRMLVVVNLHPEETLHDVRIKFPRRAMRFLGWDTIAGSSTVPVLAQDRLGEVKGEEVSLSTTPSEMDSPGLLINQLRPMTAAYYDLQSTGGMSGATR
ncbi:MAG: alpha-amylase family glycosyl hydrolase [Chthoniobacterales bacterium]|jgi:glycosidase